MKFKKLKLSETGLSSHVFQMISECFRKYSEIELAVLYGSRAMSTYSEGSDIDLSLIGKSLNMTTLLRLSDELDDLLLPYTFDLSLYDDIEQATFKDHIDRVGITFYSND